MNPHSPTAQLESLRHDFAVWRSQKKYSAEPIPSPLWRRVLQLIPVIPIRQIQKTLRVGYQRLKEGDFNLPPESAVKQEPFISLGRLTPSVASRSPWLELNSPGGLQLRLHGQTDPALLLTILERFK